MSLKQRIIAAVHRRLRNHPNATWLERWLGSLFLRYFPRQLTCAQFESFVLDYYEGRLSTRERARFDFHMRICPMCDVHFQTYVQAVELGRELYRREELEEPAPLPDDLVAAILDVRRVED